MSNNSLNHFEVIDENLRLIDSVATLMIAANGVYADDALIADCMTIISRLSIEARQSNDARHEEVQEGGNV